MVAKRGTWNERKWELAPALIEFEQNVDAAWPGRAKQSDGSIASARHLKNSPNSDHNPNRNGLVTAVDITHDPNRGVDCRVLWDVLMESQDARIKYVIFSRQIFSGAGFHTEGAKHRGGPWKSGTYSGYSAHLEHLHLSIWGGKHAGDAAEWPVGSPHQAPVGAAAREKPSFLQETEAALLGAGADPNSLSYNLRFYRRLAGKAGIDGSKPEAVADWLLDILADHTASIKDIHEGHAGEDAG